MEWPLVGRESTLRRLTAMLDRHAASSVTIAGEEGVGKTRLAAELAKAARARGHWVERISASPSAAPIPFGAIAPLLTLPAHSSDLSVLMSSLMGELQQRNRDRGSLFLLVDDAHQLDEHSAALLHQAAAHRVASVVLTTRSGEPAPAVLTQLWKDRIAERVEIGPLDQGATKLLIQEVLGGPVDGLTMSELWQRSAGNPLFLRELIMGGLESGDLARDGDVWRLSGPISPSSRLSELVRNRLGSLPTAQRTIIDVLAVADVAALETLQSLADEAAVEALEARHLITVEQSGNRMLVRFAHPIYGEVTFASMPRSRARRVMRALAARLERTGAHRPDDLLRLALWRLDGGSCAQPGSAAGGRQAGPGRIRRRAGRAPRASRDRHGTADGLAARSCWGGAGQPAASRRG
jgi:predicted ATPase